MTNDEIERLHGRLYLDWSSIASKGKLHDSKLNVTEYELRHLIESNIINNTEPSGTPTYRGLELNIVDKIKSDNESNVTCWMVELESKNE